jgi:PPOX class probable F420-dependent enzyme
MTEPAAATKGVGMEAEAAREFIRKNHRGVLATYRRGETVQMTPVMAGVDGDGRVIVSSAEDRAKTRNLRRDPRASYCAFPDSFFGPSVQVEGRADVVSLPEAMEPLVDYYRRVGGEHPDWDEYRRAMERERRCLIRIEIERAVG